MTRAAEDRKVLWLSAGGIVLLVALLGALTWFLGVWGEGMLIMATEGGKS